ncbi:MAG TPA: ribbon-helix-helix domain-containing protein [Firmicutes bacterium]|nr:ribbon-helix-helix domain-containing protein [Bacillota bacterium]
MAEFIPKQYRKEQFTIRMEQEILEKVDRLAGVYKLSRSEFINQCVAFALEHMPGSAGQAGGD